MKARPAAEWPVFCPGTAAKSFRASRRGAATILHAPAADGSFGGLVSFYRADKTLSSLVGHYARPPIESIEYEMDLRGCSGCWRETVI